MLRRLLALILALACAFAPVTWAFELQNTAADDCCCGSKCACPGPDCAAPPTARTQAAPTNLPATAQRAIAAQPKARVATLVFARFLSDSHREPGTSLRIRYADTAPAAASVALFQAHCSLRI